MNLIVIVLLALLGLILFGIGGQSTVGVSTECLIAMDGTERCSPETSEDGSFQIVPGDLTIRVVVNNGPVAPDSREGYAIDIISNGSVQITETKPAAGSSTGAQEIVTTLAIGETGVQQLLTELNSCGFFFLPQRSEFSDSELPDGGSTSLISIHLADGDWEVLEAHLDGVDEFQFESCQSLIADYFDLQPSE